MKKLFLSVLVAIIMIVALYQFGFFSSYNYFTAKSNIKKNLIGIVLIDQDEYVYQKEKKIANKYGLNITNLQGDLFLSRNGVVLYNRIMRERIRYKIGEIMYKKYTKEMDSLQIELMKFSIP